MSHVYQILGPWSLPSQNVFFAKHFKNQHPDKLKSCHWLWLSAANGLDIPYVGYLELDRQVLGWQIPNSGMLGFIDPLEANPNSEICGDLGMNMISECYRELFLEHSPTLFDLPLVWEDVWQQAFAHGPAAA